MARMLFTEGFLDDAATIWSPAVEAHLKRMLEMLETFPEAGSNNVSDFVRQHFGDNVRKCSVAPFDLIYEYIPEEDVVLVYGLTSQKMAR